MNRYGEELSPKYYTQPSSDLELPCIKTPVYLNSIEELVNWTYCTQEDAKQACPKCQAKSPNIFATLATFEFANWYCMCCYHRWSTHRGIYLNPRLF